MSVQDFIRAMPKVELNVQLHGAMKPGTITTIADQNDVTENIKHFQTYSRLLNAPEIAKLDDLARTVSGWVMQPDDLKLLVYEAATALHKQNVRYAEISIDPTLYAGLALQPDEFLTLINDGRDRAQRAWGIKVAWIIMLPRDEPKRAADFIRWAGGLAARRNGVAAIGLGGRESVLPVGQFEVAFRQAEKRELPRVVRAGDEQGADAVLKTLDVLVPNRILDGRGAESSPEVLDKMRAANVALIANLSRAVRHGWVKELAEHPLRKLYDAGITVALGSDMPSFYGTSLVNEYTLAVENGLLSLEELEEVSLNAVRASFLDEADKTAMIEAFRAEYARLRPAAENA